MKFSFTSCALWALTCCIDYAAAVASTDSYRDADVAQTGYLPNHNMDPAVVDSAQFGQLWKVSFNAKEQFYAKPLVFTPAATGAQILFLASSQNYIRTLNAKTGAVLNKRQVHPPFLQSDIGCTDIPNTIGIIGTPVIDPNTEIAYFFSKTYIPNYRVAGNTGVSNGVYYFHGVYLDTLQDVPGFPILIDGSVADNDVNDYFVGGVVLQRPSLVQVGNYVYGGFGGHCDLFNYTGLVVGIDVVNKNIASQWAVSVGPLVPHSGNLLQNGAGGEGGIWQSGVGLSTDGSRLFFATGNGNADQNNGVPATGRSGCQTLGESVVNLAIDTSTGKLSTQDYFQPYDYENMDGGDQDFGSGGVTLLDPTVFKGTGVNRMAVGAGKNGKIYIMNADNLGGYKQGPGGSDGVVQTINTQKAVFGGSGSYPLEGGFLYSTPVGYPTYVYQLGFDGAGVPQFAQVASTKETSAGRVGVGIPTITSLNGQPGTAILWMTDPDAGIRAWYAVPKSDGTMKSIAMPQIQGVNKFQRPAFGDTRLYTTDASGNLYCLGSPVNLPLNCSSPVDFGSVSLGSSAKQIVNCTALININQITNIQTADSNFVVHLSDLPKGAITAGQQFSFPVLWNLTQAVVNNAVNASFGSTSPGFKSTPLTITTNNAVTGFATVFPISLTGKEVSQAPFLDTTPSTVDFGGVILVGASGDSDGKTIESTMTIRNDGLAPLVVTGYAWTQDEIDDDDVDWTNITQADDGTFILGPGFYATDLPPVNSTVNPSQSIIVDLIFAPNNGTGNYFSFFNIWTNGGVTDTILEGSASTAPVANMSISTSEHGWTDVTAQSAPVMDFGYVQAGTTQSLQIKICNEGGSVLDISKSKPPNGVFYISDPAELHEELQIAPNTCAYGTVLMSPPTEHYNQPDQQVNNTWTLNTDDLNFGVHVVQIQGVVQSVHVGPQNSTGNPTYTYLGCFQDNTNGKLLPNQLYAGNNNTNGMCQNLATPGGYVFTGTEYQIECYAGNTPPPLSLQVQDSLCNYPCAGNQNDTCGGNTGTGLISVFYDATRYTPGSNATSGPGGLPIPPNVGNFTYSGCWSDNVNGRALNGFAPNAPANGTTYESCAAACLGYEFFGVEYGNQCFCGNNVGNGAVLQASNNPDVNGCGMFCQGDSSEYCGGPNRMNVFQYNGTLPTIPSNGAGNNGNNNNDANPGPSATTSIQNTTSNGAYNYFGCWLDNVAGRALTNHALNGQTVGPDTCAAACSGYQYFGLEYGDECYCANTIGANSTVAPGGSNTASNGCNMACSGASNFTCGGPNRLSLYSLSANANITRIVDPVTVGSFGNWTYQGCYSEATNARALSQLQMPVPSANLTVQTCAAACSGYTYFGVEYASQCFCSNYISAGSSLVVGSSPSSTGCNMVCSGNSTQYCGGPNRLNLYMSNQGQSNSPASSSTKTQSSTSAASSLSSLSPVTSATTIDSSSNSTATSLTSGSSTASTPSVMATSAISNSTLPQPSMATSSSSAASSSSVSSSSSVLSASSSSSNSTTTSFVSSIPSSSVSSASTSANATSLVIGSSTTSTTNNTTQSSMPSSSTTQSNSSLSTLASSTLSAPNGTSSGSAILTSSSYTASPSVSTNSSTLSSTPASSSPSVSSSPSSWSTSSILSSSSSSSVASSSSASSSTSSSASSSLSQATSSTSSSFSFSASTSRQSSSSSSSATSSISSISSSSSSASSTSSSASSSSSSSILSSTLLTSTSTSSITTSSSSAAATIAGEWVAYGCYTEATNMRALSDLQNPISGPNVTNENCAKACAGYTYFGTEYSSECYCGYQLNTGSVPASSGCSMSCSGNSSEICGGGNRLTVYKSQSVPPPQPVTVGNSTNAQYIGCYSEATNSRALTDLQYAVPAANVTVEACLKACSKYRYFGVEYASQCFCGNTIHAGSILVQGSTPSQTGCNMVCQGNSTEYCGGPNRLNMYMTSNATAQG